IDPGTGKPMAENGVIPSASTAPDIDPDEILSALDTDTRSYLQLLVTGAGKGLKGRGGDLQETYARLGPTNRDLARVNSAVARRKGNLKNLINKYGLLTTELATKDRQITRLVRSSNQVFESLATQNNQIASAVNKLPGTLDTTSDTLEKVDTFGQRLTPALQSLRPAIRKLDPANKAVLPLVREATPQIRDQIRPFTRIATPYIRDLGTGAKGLSAGAPDLTTSLNKLNRLFNIAAFNPNGAEGLTGNPQTDRDRQEGYLYWLAWTAQNTNSLFSTADAMGPLRRITLGGLSCSILTAQLGGPTAALPPPLNGVVTVDQITDLLGSAGVCTNG
ncbi:MAG TPA: hypothetical protein VEX39_13895, partial [Thermoleophilaceae bacterium]|nr:hypothetical protein [Thermoleophilaceae bacterium]